MKIKPKFEEAPLAAKRFAIRQVRKNWTKWERAATKSRGALVRFQDIRLVADDTGIHFYFTLSPDSIASPGPIPNPSNWDIFSGLITRGMRPGHSVIVTKAKR